MKYAVANWKMHKTAEEASHYIAKLPHKHTHAHIWLSVPFTSIAVAAHAVKGTPILVGAQNMHEASHGAFTGEISASMLKEVGASFVLLGHSERRHLFGETDARLKLKLQRAQEEGLAAIFCVGEHAGEDRKATLSRQLAAISDTKGLLIAYEPVWAIGTGKTATLDHIHEAHAFIRSHVGAGIPILYGGSVNADNAASLGKAKEVGGLLVGGASLNPDTFTHIIKELS